MEHAKLYLKAHWLPILIGAVPTVLVAFVSIINYVIASNISYQELKIAVDADTLQEQNVLIQNQKLLLNDAQIKQRQDDQGVQLTNIQSDIQDIHRYFFKGINGQ